MSTETKRFFFVIGMPRSRTAWLSVLLTGADSFCFHEGTLGRDWASYVAMLRARPEGAVGDSNPGLVGHIDTLIKEFPGARFLVVRRDPAEALESLHAAFPEVQIDWVKYLEVFESAVAKLPEYLELNFRELENVSSCYEAHRHLLDAPLDLGRWNQLSMLRVTTVAPAPRLIPPTPLEVSVSVDGFDFAGLTVRSYVPGDLEMVAEWFKFHKDATMGQMRIPPLGIIVQDEEGPAAALWCYETYGTGVAWIALPVTRPGLDYARACTVMAFAIMAIAKLAGSGYQPRAHFDCFRVICPPSMGRLLKRLGFTEQPNRGNYFLST